MKRPFSPDTPPTRYDREDFRRQVYQVVRAIPRGRVLSYGGIARLIGHPSHARAVGTALKNAPEGIPCHRVVDSRGRIVPGWARQRELLEGEGGVSPTRSGWICAAARGTSIGNSRVKQPLLYP